MASMDHNVRIYVGLECHTKTFRVLQGDPI